MSPEKFAIYCACAAGAIVLLSVLYECWLRFRYWRRRRAFIKRCMEAAQRENSEV